MSRYCCPFFILLNKSFLGPLWISKNGFANFTFSWRFAKYVCPRSQRLQWQSFIYLKNIYKTYGKKTKNLIWIHFETECPCSRLTRCQRSHWLRVYVELCRHVMTSRMRTWLRLCMREWQYYADTNAKLWRLLTDFKGTIRWKKYWCALPNPIAIIKKYENGRANFELCDRLSLRKQKVC